MYVYMCVSVCVCVCVLIYKQIKMQIHVYACKYINIQTLQTYINILKSI